MLEQAPVRLAPMEWAELRRLVRPLSGRLLEIYKMKRDGSYFDQQEFAHLLRENEAAASEIRNVEREERAAAIRAEEASRNNRYEVDRDWRQAQISIQVKAAQDKLDRNIANAPFSYTPECSEGELLDADRQQVWGKSDPEGLVRYVVAPAYVANGVRYCLQRVVMVERA